MDKQAILTMIIAVAGEQGLIIDAPKEIKDIFEGIYCDDNSFKNVPKKTGVYICNVEFYFHQGYFEGYKADGESDWEFKIISSSKIEIPNVLIYHEIRNCDLCGKPLKSGELNPHKDCVDREKFLADRR